MRKYLLFAVLFSAGYAFSDEITFTFVNLAGSTFSASASGLEFSKAANVLVTNNDTGKSVMLVALDSGNTGAATDFMVGPPLEADYNGAGANSVLVAAGGHTFLSGEMDDLGRLEAQYPNKAGAFLSRFKVDFVDPAVLMELGSPLGFEADGSVSLTLAQTSFVGGVLDGTLGGGQITIETQATAVPETATLMLVGTGLVMLWGGINKRRVRCCI